MPLQYIIDGYNITNHIKFIPNRKKIKGPQKALLEFLRNRWSGSKPKKEIIVVFDGYPDVSAQDLGETDIRVVFSREETADARIKRLVESSKNPKNIVVVSDDREIIFFIKSIGARSIGVEEFINPAEETPQRGKEDLIKAELNYSQISEINQELRALWLSK